MPDSPDVEVELKGGIANAGAVTRLDDTVRRPAPANISTIHALLRHLRAEGCGFVPQPLGTDGDGREVLEWIPGEAASDPWPDWISDPDLLVSVAATQAQLHRAASNFVAPPGATWARSGGNYFPPGTDGLLVCHNDLSVTNVIVDPEAAAVVGVIDWDFAKPVRPLFDIMVTARHWVPFAPPPWRVPCLRDTDASQRLGLFADAHGLTLDERQELLALAAVFIEQAASNIVALAAEAGPDSGYQALLDRGYLKSITDTLTWLPSLTP